MSCPCKKYLSTECLWCADPSYLGEGWDPSECGLVVNVRPLPDGGTQTFVYAEKMPQEPHLSTIRRWAFNFLNAGCGQVTLHIKDRIFLALPTREEELDERPFTLLRHSPTEWTVLFFANDAECQMMLQVLNSNEGGRA